MGWAATSDVAERFAEAYAAADDLAERDPLVRSGDRRMRTGDISVPHPRAGEQPAHPARRSRS